VAADKKTATIGGGASIGDVIAAANSAGALVITGNCNCVGALGAMLGGGHGMQHSAPWNLVAYLTHAQVISWAKPVLALTTSSPCA
jgi:hypothetical protein